MTRVLLNGEGTQSSNSEEQRSLELRLQKKHESTFRGSESNRITTVKVKELNMKKNLHIS